MRSPSEVAEEPVLVGPTTISAQLNRNNRDDDVNYNDADGDDSESGSSVSVVGDTSPNPTNRGMYAYSQSRRQYIRHR